MECRRKTKQDEPAPKKKQEEVIEDRVEEDIDFDIEEIYFESSDEE